MFRFSFSFGKATANLVCFAACLLPAFVQGATPPPTFLDPTPADTVVACYNDRPAAVTLDAQTVNGIVSVTPFDSLSNGASTVCSGGIVFRIWQVADSEGTSRVQQQIVFGPPTDGPSLDPTLDVSPDTVECTEVNNPINPLSYGTWLNGIQLRVLTAIQPGCAPIAAITNDGPPTFDDPGCGNVIEVTFTVTDQCGATAEATFTYVVVDNLPPVLSEMPANTSISCSDPIPAPPIITAADCGDQDLEVFFTQTDDQGNGGCAQFEYEIVRNWTAFDTCGNTASHTQTITVFDNDFPTFDRPSNLTLACTEDWNDLALTGEPTLLADNCTAANDLDVSFSDNIIFQPDCNFNFNVRRTWTVTDRCGNATTEIQNIFVQDNVAPTFTPPTDVTVNCEDVQNFPVVGEPTNLVDLCTPNPNLSFTDVITPGSCPNDYTIERTWRIFDDCGNDEFYVQSITVIDTTPPAFINEPSDLILTCNNEVSQGQRFSFWLDSLAGARAADLCTPEANLTYQLFISGTNEVPVFPDFACGSGEQSVRRLDVDVVVTDECGNVSRRTVRYRQLDTNPPNLFACMESQVVATDPGVCSSSVALLPPTITDQCVTGLPTQHNSRDTVVVTSDAEPGQEGNVPVNTVELAFPINIDLPINALNESTLTITLENADAEGTDEFFLIYGEDGTLLDSTELSGVQCADVTTVVMLTRQQFNFWATDGVVNITLVPNQPAGQPGSFAVNDLCAGGTRVLGHLFTPIRRLAPLRLEAIIDAVDTFLIDPIDTFFVELDAGLHQVTYRATDCAGNTDECLFTITVEDNIAPQLSCPPDVQVVLNSDSCQVTLTLPLPPQATDNCSVYETVTLEGPTATGDRFLPFFFDPNLGTFQAGAVEFDFPPIDPFTVDSTEIEVVLRGDFSGTAGILDVYDNDDNLLGSSPPNLVDCSGGQTTFTISLSANQFNGLIVDGDFGLRLQPREVSVPPGQPGDGVNPCTNDPTLGNGDSDGFSFAYVRLTYNLLRPNYFTTGATVTPPQFTTDAQPQPQITFQQGITEFNYVIADPSGNTDTCSFEVEVLDNAAPIAICLPTTIFVDPSGLDPVTIDPSEIDGGSFDNCGLDTLTLNPATFGCDQIGSSATVTLSVFDGSGNQTDCSTLVSVSGEPPVPTATSSFCGGDSLFLFANPPTVASPGQVIYSYAWFDPAGNQFSTQENPIIPGIDVNDEGPYRVVITGLTGCSSEGIVNVNVEDLPVTPVIAAPQSVCIGDPIPLGTATSFNGTVEYRWFEGAPGAGTLLGSSLVPQFDVLPPHGTTGRDFYLQVLVNGCPSGPSVPISVGTVARPTVMAVQDSLAICELDVVTLQAQNDPSLNFEWSGPNGFTASGPVVQAGPLNTGFTGHYRVQGVLNEGCFSAFDSVYLEVIPAPAATTLTGNGPVCAGSTLELTAADTTAADYLFVSPTGQSYSVPDPTLILADANNDFMGAWRVTINDGTCSSGPSPPLTININTPPVASAVTLPDPVCTGLDVVLQGSSTVTGSTYAWTGPGNFASQSVAPVLEEVNASDGGMYILNVTAPNGCVDVDTLEVNVLPGVAVLAIEPAFDDCLSGGETVALVADISPVDTNGTYAYAWSGPNGLSGAGDTLFIPDVSPANSGTYNLTVNDGMGCDSPPASFTVDLEFAPEQPLAPITADGEIGYCLGSQFTLSTTDYGPGVDYFWQLPDGSMITTTENTIDFVAFDVDFSGNYRVRVVRDGCPSPQSEPTEVIITDFPNLAATAQSPVCAGSPIGLQVTDLTGADYAWRGPNNFSSSLPNPMITTADAAVHNGTYEVVVTIGGCDSDTLAVDVAVQPTPATPVGVPQAALCIDDPQATLNLVVNANTTTPGATYQWLTDGGMVPVTSPGQGTNVPLTNFGLFPNGGAIDFFVRAELNGCLSPLSNALTIQLDIADGDAADAGVDTTVCEGIHLLDANVPLVGNGRWELLAGGGDIFIANPNSSTTAVDGMTEFGSPYQFIWSLSNGECKDYSRDTITITVTSGEEAVGGPDRLVCLNEDIRLAAQPAQEPGSVGTWSQNLAQDILGVVIVDPNDPETTIEGLEANNVYSFTWTVQSDCGTKTDVVLVNVSDPNPFAGDDQIVCNSERATVLLADEASIGSEGRWISPDPDLTIDDDTSPNTMVGNLAEGDNLLIWEVDGGLCGPGSRDTVIINYKVPAQPEDDEINVPFQGSLTFDPLSNDLFPPGTFPELVEEVEIGQLTINSEGLFTYESPPNFAGRVTVEYLLVSEGCTASSATIIINVGLTVACEAPNIFTPNDDGVNDRFVVPCLLQSDRFPQNEVTIYNQWGDEVFRAGPYENDFDGTFNGEPLPVGTYFYHIRLGDGSPDLSGHLRIQR